MGNIMIACSLMMTLFGVMTPTVSHVADKCLIILYMYICKGGNKKKNIKTQIYIGKRLKVNMVYDDISDFIQN